MPGVAAARIRPICLLLGILGALVTARPSLGGDDESDGAYAAVHARRLLVRADADRNGTVDRTEAERLPVDPTKFDADGDGALDERELRRVPIRHLRSRGSRRLNLLYKTTPEEDLYLDLYLPADQGGPPAPLVIYTHGGGWVTGGKENIATGPKRDVATALLDAGFAVAAINYRLCDARAGVFMRDCVVDARDALRYLATHARQSGLDPDAFLVFGDSAGGQIAQLLVLLSPQDGERGDAPLAAPYRVRAGVSWYGPCDFRQAELFDSPDGGGAGTRFGSRIHAATTPADEAASRVREMSPVAHLTPGSAPLLLVHGDRDTTIPVAHARLMKSRGDSVGAPVDTMIIRNAGHNWRPAGGPIDPPVNAIVARTVEFLTVHGNGAEASRRRVSKTQDSSPAANTRSEP